MKTILHIIVLLFIFDGCIEKDYSYYKLDLSNNKKSKGEIITNHIDRYIYNLKITKDYYCFLSNQSNNTIINIYKNNFTLKYEHILFIDSLSQKSKKDYFTKEVSQKSNSNTLFLIHNKKQLLELNITKNHINIDTLSSNLSPNSRDYNIISNDFFASTFEQPKKSPYYHFSNLIYKWTDPDPLIKKKISSSISYINHLCVNEKYKRAVVAYRFINFLSFYNLDGKLKCTVEIETNKISKKIKSTDANITKFFIDIYGTEKYVYCLYSGSKDLTVPSKILKFNWNGKHIDTFLLDRPIQLFSVDEKKKCIIAISSYNTEGQNIIQYNLE